MSSELVSLRVISTGNDELDNRLGGGLPIPSLTVLEGDNGTGKTVLCVLFTIGFLNEGHKVVYITTENSVRGLLEQSKNISLDLTGDFVKGNVMVIPAHLENIRWSGEQVGVLLDVLISFAKEVTKKYDVIVIDSLTLMASYLGMSELHRLLSELRSVVKRGATIILTIHPGVLSEEVMKAFSAAADVYFRLSLAAIGGRTVKLLKVIKIRGAPTIAEPAIAFDIDPAFGIKIVPIAMAQA